MDKEQSTTEAIPRYVFAAFARARDVGHVNMAHYQAVYREMSDWGDYEAANWLQGNKARWGEVLRGFDPVIDYDQE